MIILIVRMIIPPHPKWHFRKFTGRSQLLGVPSYWAFPWTGGGGARPWPSGAAGEESGAGSGPPMPGSGPGPGPRHFLVPKRHLAMAWHITGGAQNRGGT